MKWSTNKATILFGGDLTLTSNSNATWMTDDLTHHMLSNAVMSWMAMAMSMVWATDLMIPLFSPWFVSSCNFAGAGFLKILVNISFSSTDWPFCYIIWPNVGSYRSWCFTISMEKIKLDKWQNVYLPNYEIYKTKICNMNHWKMFGILTQDLIHKQVQMIDDYR